MERSITHADKQFLTGWEFLLKQIQIIVAMYTNVQMPPK